jgi:multidrug resistance efflux pump
MISFKALASNGLIREDDD